MIETPWGSLGYITYKRTYARRLDDNTEDINAPTEELYQTIDRVIKACDTQLHVGFTKGEEEELKELLLGLKGSVAGRFLWQLGTDTVNKLGLLSLQNCAFVTINEPVRPFIWAMDALMLGSGVGYNIQKENVAEIPRVKRAIKVIRKDTKDADFIVPDSREGWIELLKKTLKYHFSDDGRDFSYSTVCLRGKGAPIKSFGGVSSGPEELCWGINEINNVLNARVNKKLRPIDVLDIMNIIGYIVVSGNVRRSAQIAIGDMEDMQYLNAKRWDKGNIPNWRAMSNNSVVCNDINYLPEQFWQGYAGNGEPYGLINLKLAREVGRLGETKYPDPNVQGFNPCQPSFAKVLTPEGIKTFDDIQIGSKIWSKTGWTTVTNKWSNGIKPVYSFEYTGGAFIGTETHKIDTSLGKVEAFLSEDALTIAGPVAEEIGHIPAIIMDGLFFGDGYHKKMKGREYVYPVLLIGEKDKDYFTSEISSFIKNKFSTKKGCEEYNVDTTILDEEKEKTYNLSIPSRYMEADKSSIASFLRGLFSADGSVILTTNNTGRVSYKTASKILVRQVQVLLSSLGIRSYITTNKEKEVTFSNGTYTCKESYDLNVSKDISTFYKYIGFIQKYKMERLATLIEHHTLSNKDTYTSLKEKTFLGDYEVFDITVDNESHTYWTGGVSVSNCAEQSLESWETCCLSEVFLPNISSIEELKKIITYLYRVNKHSLALPCHLTETQEVVHKNMRMGIGITGYLQATEEQRSWLKEAYEYLRSFDAEYSKQHGWPTSIKLTTTKPSGTLSLLAGVTPGVHPGYSQYFIRRIRMASNSPLVKTCKEHGYPVEYQKNFDGSDDRNTVVVSFPCSYPKGTVLAKDVTAIQQLEYVKELQANWSDNAVSCTVYYKKEELSEIKEWLKNNYNNSIKSVSFLLHKEHGFIQAPFEEISEASYNAMLKRVRPLTNISFNESDINESFECASGVCPIK